MSRFIRLASFSALTLTRLHINEFEIAKRRSLVCEKLMNDGSKSTSELSIASPSAVINIVHRVVEETGKH